MADLAVNEADLGPLAWVKGELSKSLDMAVKALRRFAQEAEHATGSDLSSIDTSQLRVARTHIHQAMGAMEMVGWDKVALLLRAMEQAVSGFIPKPQACNPKAVGVLESGAFAVLEYLDASLAGRNPNPVLLFPQYRNLQTLNANSQIHPSDLWGQGAAAELRALSLPQTPAAELGEIGRRRLDQAVLHLIRGQAEQGAEALTGLALGLANADARTDVQSYWGLVAGYAQGIARGRIPLDMYAKKTLPGIVNQYVSFSAEQTPVVFKGVRELMFHCAVAGNDDSAPLLQAVRKAYGVDNQEPLDYNKITFGNFDPTLLVQARKRLALAKEMWAAYTGGDLSKSKSASDQMGLLIDSIQKLLAQTDALPQALRTVVQKHVSKTDLPPTEVALETATTILYLEAMLQDFDPADAHLRDRADELATRLNEVLQGMPSRPMTAWMEELYHQFSEKSTLGSVVGELRSGFSEIEKSLDTYFRDPQQSAPLPDVAARLGQMRGVFTVLGVDQAAQAILHIRDWVEDLVHQRLSVEQAAKPGGVFEKIGSSLGALGFLVDMLGYQPQLAKQLFVFDVQREELVPVMGRSQATLSAPHSDAPPAKLQAAASPVPPAPLPVLEDGFEVLSLDLPGKPAASAPAPVPAPVFDSSEEDDLQDIFLEEAREVVANASNSLRVLAAHPGDSEERTALRRAFHTLKGSSRMVGLTELGEAAWAMEQAHNASLAESPECSLELQTLSSQALHGFGLWIEDVARQGSDQGLYQADPFRASADALRLERRVLPLVLPEPGVDAGISAFSEPDIVIELAAPPEPSAEEPVQEVIEAPVLGEEHTELPALEVIEAQAMPEEVTVEPEVPEIPKVVVEELPLPEIPLEAPLQETSVDIPAQAAAEPLLEAPEEVSALEDENIKVVGQLRINLSLYNVYLSEADEWSRWLQAEMSELQIQTDRAPTSDAVAWAHSLAGSSATVGLDGLSSLAREMEAALAHAHEYPALLVAPARTLFVQSTEEIRRVLHQFAAGFETPVDASLGRRLAAFARTVYEAPPPAADVEPVDEPVHVRPDLFVVPKTAPVPTQAPIEDDELDVEDMVDPDLFPIFEEEALELLPNLGTALRQWHNRVDNRSARQEALRLMHTIKGSARLAGALKLGELVHRMESQAEHLGDGTRPGDIDPILQEFDKVAGLFEALRARDERAYQEALDQVVVEAPEAAEAEPEIPVMPQSEVPVAPTPPQVLPDSRALEGVAAPTGLVVKQSNQTVRVKASLLDRLVNQAGEVMMTRSRLESEVDSLRGSLTDLTGNLDKLRMQLRDIELQAETQMQSRMALAKEAQANFDPLEFDRFTRVQELTRMMAESVNDVATIQRNLQRTLQNAEDDLVDQGRQARELQRDLLRTRMVEFESISERLYRVVRLASKETGKGVRLDITGGKIEMDRGVLDRMAPAFEHILRNCVAHGIEDELTRARTGKDATGTISIALSHEGNDVTVAFADDGGGLNMDRIRSKALSLGLLSTDDILTEARAGELIFMPGFSTATEVSELAGRGIGMDVVRAEVLALGGRVETSFKPAQGTQFKLVLPLTTAVTQVVMIRAGHQSVGVPSTMVEIVRRASPSELEQAYRTGTLDVGHGETVPYYWAGALLQSSPRSREPVGRTTPIVVFRSAAQRVAMHVDEVLGNQEVVVKNLGPQLSRLPGLAGMTLLPSGASVLIYNPVALATVYGSQSRDWTARVQAQEAAQSSPALRKAETAAATPVQTASAPLVLVVDDSITVRKVTQRLLQREGYRVSLAADGLQALERLQEELPSVVLSDIEMPRMDGFDLARNIRGDAKMKHLPIVMITSRIADKHREHAANLGVNHYLGKPYSEDELLGLVKRYCSESVEA